MRIAVVALAVVLHGAAASRAAAQAAPVADSLDARRLIEQAARDYLEGWYAGDTVRVGRALHPDLVKRHIRSLPSGRQVVFSLTRDQMVEMTRFEGGTRTPADRRGVTVRVLGVSGEIAVVEASSVEYVEYLSLARCNGRWVIVNILWRATAPEPEQRR
jgi:hypothetical protein